MLFKYLCGSCCAFLGGGVAVPQKFVCVYHSSNFIVSTLYFYGVLELSNKSETPTCYKSFNRDSHNYFMLVYCPSISELPTEIIKAWVILSGILSTNTVYTA